MMLKIRYFAGNIALTAAVAFAMNFSQGSAAAADGQNTSAEKQRKLISVLQSDAAPQEKAITCKQLAVYGTKDAVPALAALLPDPSLSSWARIALEAIPDPAADEALRKAIGQVQGRLLIGVINSIAYRRDAQAVAALVERLKDADAGVASAAAVALGRIGGDEAAKTLTQALSAAPAGIRSAVAQGCILCAEKYLAEGNSAEAVKLYDTVRKAEAPKQRQLEATRGAILARKSAGIPLLIEQLRSADKALFGIGLRTARELPGRDVTEALAAELERSNPDKQPLILLALADRQDEAVTPALLAAAKNSPKKVRAAALSALERVGGAGCIPVLLEAAAGNDADLAQPAKSVLARLPGNAVDNDLYARLPQSQGRTRQVLIELAGQRRIEAALPVIVRCAEDTDAGVRSAAVEAIGDLGVDKQAALLVRLMQNNQNSKERADIEKALLALASRCGASTVPYLLPLTKSDQGALRMVALHTLASVGGAEALAAVKSAASDEAESVQDEAVSVLSKWPNNWPDDNGVAEPLLALAKSGKKTSHQVLGLRGYLQYVQGAKMDNSSKAGKINELLPLITRPEEKRLAIAVISAIPTAKGLEPLMTFAEDPAIAEEAYMAIVNLAGKKDLQDDAKELCQKALQGAVEKSKNETTRKKAGDALRKIK